MKNIYESLVLLIHRCFFKEKNMQAVLILAHKDIDQLIELTKVLNSTFNVYIHVDKKAKLSSKQIDILDNLDRVFWISTQNVHWGAWSIVQATIDLIKLALEEPSNSYFHLISGQDWPTKDPQKIYDFFDKDNKLYIWNYASAKYKKFGEPLVDWQKFYFNYDKINRKSTYGKIYHRLSIILQSIFRVNKLNTLGVNLTLYNGSQWVDLPRDAVEYLINYLASHPNVEKMFKTGFCSDEFWIPTILRNNSLFAKRIDTDNHRYIDWHERNNSFPAILDKTDYQNIIQSDALFMRKIEFPTSKGLINSLGEKND